MQRKPTLPAHRPRAAVYNPSIPLMGGGEKVTLALASVLSRTHEVTVFSRGDLDRARLESFLNVDLSGIHLRQLPGDDLITKLTFRVRPAYGPVNAARERAWFGYFRRQGFDLFVNQAHQSQMANPSRRGIYSCMFPEALAPRSTRTRILARLGLPSGRAAIDTYGSVVSNSEFVRGWMRRLWGEVDAEILYPICDSMADPSVPRRKVILNVGRFFDVGTHAHHHKRQDVLADVFAEMTDLHEEGWELHLAGALSDSPAHAGFVDDLRRRCADLPIHLHPNASYEDLRRLYNEATIYWHATGYGFDPDVAPSAQEHFGISTVEAMSAGAVPVVIGTAGQTETVEDGISGVLWHSLDELRAATRALAGDADRTSTMSSAARSRSAAFGPEAFAERVSRAVARA